MFATVAMETNSQFEIDAQRIARTYRISGLAAGTKEFEATCNQLRLDQPGARDLSHRVLQLVCVQPEEQAP